MTDRSTVALVRCDTYDPDAVYAAMRRGVELLGGLDRFVRPGELITLKPNILAGDGPDSAVSTHPSVVAASARLFQEGGAHVVFGDSPGLENAHHAAQTSGILEAGLRAGADLGDFALANVLATAKGSLVPNYPIAQPIYQADGIINLPKLKTHQLTRLTGSVKNMFGCIPGKRKAAYHVQFQDVMAFCRLLVELNMTLRPRLHVMDAIVAMEGNGPRSGDKRQMNLLALSVDPVALDATCCRLAALDPTYMPTNVVGEKLGLGQYRAEAIECIGDTDESFLQPDFKLIRKPVYGNATYAYFNAIKGITLPRPVIDASRCTQCGACVRACPVPEKAVHFGLRGDHRPPVYDYDLCIRCYCCHEMCPNRAIHKHTPLLGHVLRLG